MGTRLYITLLLCEDLMKITSKGVAHRDDAIVTEATAVWSQD